MLKVGLFSIASKNYLAYVRVLFESVAKFHPNYRRYLCLADKVDGYFRPEDELFEVVETEEIGIPNFQDMSLRYDIMEFNTAVKPFMIEWLFNHSDLDVVIYLDPDIKLFSKLDKLEAEIVNGASVVLTPHITEPLEDEFSPNDFHMIQSGVFNLGFIAVRRCEESIKFIQWWGRRLKTQCASDVSNNLFTDQKWCDLAPCFLDKLKIFKDPSYNIAYWNLAQRKVMRSSNGQWLAEGKPLVFFHFSGVNASQRKLVSKHQNRFGWKDIEPCQPLFENYLDALVAADWSVSRYWPYAYAKVSEDFKISSVIRKLYRDKYPQPLSLEGGNQKEFLIKLCNHLTVANNLTINGGAALTDLMVLVYLQRPDLQMTFGLNAKEGTQHFAHWFESSGKREYELPPEVTHQSLIRGTEPSSNLKKVIARKSYLTISYFECQARMLSVYFPASIRDKGRLFRDKLKARLSKLM